jgi:hypothetical protein
MKQVYRAALRFLAEEEAHSPIEYSSMLAMIILTIDVSVTSVGSYVTNPFWDTSNALQTQNSQLASRGLPPPGSGS